MLFFQRNDLHVQLKANLEFLYYCHHNKFSKMQTFGFDIDVESHYNGFFQYQQLYSLKYCFTELIVHKRFCKIAFSGILLNSRQLSKWNRIEMSTPWLKFTWNLEVLKTFYVFPNMMWLLWLSYSTMVLFCWEFMTKKILKTWLWVIHHEDDTTDT